MEVRPRLRMLGRDSPGVHCSVAEVHCTLSGKCAPRAATLATAVLVCTKFYQVNKLSGYLLYPYVAFLLFANALNISIATKNPNVRRPSVGSCIACQVAEL